ncbi:MAG: transcriptional repressor [Coriobacteriia bacterium]|nr:transcriptional repressor [Coriobacteriia bacterium]
MQTTEQAFREEMARHRLRVTDNRLAIIYAFIDSGKPLTIHEIIQSSKGIGSFSSVYRSVEAMTSIGVLNLVPRGFTNYYELGEALWPHHHHITCEYCGLSVAIDDKRIEELIHEISIQAGLEPTRHDFELFGLCRNCQSAKHEPS